MSKKKYNLYFNFILRNIRFWNKIPYYIQKDPFFQKICLRAKPDVFKYFHPSIISRDISILAISLNCKNVRYLPKQYINFAFVKQVVRVNRKCIRLFQFDYNLFEELLKFDIFLLSELLPSTAIQNFIISMVQKNIILKTDLCLLGYSFFENLEFSLEIFKISNFFLIHLSSEKLSLECNKNYLVQFLLIDPSKLQYVNRKSDKVFVIFFLKFHAHFDMKRYSVIYTYLSKNIKYDSDFLDTIVVLNPFIMSFLRKSDIDIKKMKVLFDFCIKEKCIIAVNSKKKILEEVVSIYFSVEYLSIYLEMVDFSCWKLKWIKYFIRYADKNTLKKYERHLLLYFKLKPSLKSLLCDKDILKEDIENCPICLDCIQTPCILLDKHKISCRHLFCKFCINNYNKSICPVCRKRYKIVKRI